MRATQARQVIEAMRRNGGHATFAQLNRLVDAAGWGTKTPAATIRRIVQDSGEVFKIRPGLWALEEARGAVLAKLGLKPGSESSEAFFTHSYYQGLIVEIGNCKGMRTYVPPQDKNRRARPDARLGELAALGAIPQFAYPEITSRAKTVDVVWFNERRMPHSFFEVEHSTDIQNSLVKFTDLQDFHAVFTIVADKSREREFDGVLKRSAFAWMRRANRVRFVSYDKVAGQHAALSTQVI